MANTWDPEYWEDEPEIIGGAIIGAGTPTPSLPAYEYGGGQIVEAGLPVGPIIKGASTLVRKVAPYVAGGVAGLSLDDLFSTGSETGMPGQTVPDRYQTSFDVPLVGPGLKEPPAWMVAKEWHVRGGHDGRVTAQMYLLIDGRIASYNKGKGTWKVWRPKKNIVLSSNPRCNDLIKADKKIDSLMKRLAKRAGLVKRGSSRRKRVAVPAGTQIISVD